MGRQAKDLTNRRFGMLTVTERVMIDNRTHWKCKCDCGGEKITKTNLLKSGSVKTCGCRGTFKKNQEKSLKKYYTNGTYISALGNDRAINSNNTSGYRGVSYRKERNKYRAYIKYQRKDIFLGNYDNIEDAIKARKCAEEKYFGKILKRKGK